MQFPVQQFPILDSGQMNPFHQALQSGLQNYQNLVKTQYMPAGLQADIATKQAYAKYLPMQATATALSNPLFLAMLSKDPAKFKQVMNQFTNMGVNQGTPGMSGASNDQNGGSGWFKTLMNYMHGTPGSEQASNPVNATNNSQSSSASIPGSGYHAPEQPIDDSDEETSEQKVEDNVPVEGSSTSAGVVPGSNFINGGNVGSAQTSNTIVPNSAIRIPTTNALGINSADSTVNNFLANQYPSVERQQAIKANLAAQADMTKEKAASLQKWNDAADENTNNAINSERNLDTFYNTYKKSWLTGPGLGYLSKFGSESNQLNQLGTELQVEKAAELFGNRVSNFKEQLGGNIKLNVNMPEKSMTDTYLRQKYAAERLGESSDFNQTVQSYGITDPNKIKKMFYDYNRQKPFYDPNKLKALPENIGSYHQWIPQQLGRQTNRTYNPATGRIE